MRKKYFALFLIASQIIFLCGMVVFHANKLRGSDKIILKTVPYDPLSIFRGYYADLRYDINSIPVEFFRDYAPRNLKGGEEFFVCLAKGKDSWTVQKVFRQKPSGGCTLYIRGKVPWPYVYGSRVKEVFLSYGIESFFLEEKSAKEVDALSRFPMRNWKDEERLRRERIAELDSETQRLYRSGFSGWCFEKWEKELAVLQEQGFITLQAHDAIIKKYKEVFAKIQRFDESITQTVSPAPKPLFVEVAVDQDGYGHPLRLLSAGKEYK